jgi:hypothetical protein
VFFFTDRSGKIRPRYNIVIEGGELWTGGKVPCFMHREFVSQPDGGWGVEHLRRDVIKCRSAGVETHGLDPLAVKAIAEAGVDMSH